MWLTLGVLVKGELKGKAELSASGRREDRGECATTRAIHA